MVIEQVNTRPQMHDGGVTSTVQFCSPWTYFVICWVGSVVRALVSYSKGREVDPHTRQFCVDEL